jgi:predicted enzyme related to lactoylglutathione lyase
MAVPAEVPPEVRCYWMVYFAVDDVDRACTRAEELGGSKLVPAMTVQDMRFAVVEDPLGAVFRRPRDVRLSETA